MNKSNTVVFAVFVALGITLVAGLIAVPTIEKAQADLGSLIKKRIQLQESLRSQILGGSG
jgi:hypothetical protein